MTRVRSLSLIAISGLASLVAICASTEAPADPATTSVQVQTTIPRSKAIDDTVNGFGNVAVSDELTDDVAFSHPGQITELKVRPGQKVTRGQQLVTMTADPATLEAYRKAVTALDYAERELARTKTLLSQHLATNAQVAAAQKTVSDANSDVEAQRKLGNDQPFRAATAPFDGYVAKVMNSPGDRIQANTVIMQLARTDQGIRIIVGLKPEDAGRVEPGMVVRVSPVPEQAAKQSTGTVRQVSGTLNPTSRLLETWIDVTQASQNLVPGAAAEATIVIASHEGWVVPRSAVLHDDKGAYIFQVTDGKARRVDVKTGIETDNECEIAGSFDHGLKVVTSGNYELRDGMAVREAPPAQQ